MDAYSLGQFLRSAREAKTIPLNDAANQLRIRQPILEAFEAGDFPAISIPEIQRRGMLRNYSRFLELDEEHVLRLYDDALSRNNKRRRWPWRGPSRPSKRPSPMREIDIAQRRSSRSRKLLRFFLLLSTSIAALITIAYVSLALITSPAPQLQEETAPLPTQNPILPAATISSPQTPTPVLTSIASNRAVYSGSGILVSILITHRNWIRVAVDGVERYAAIARPDTLLEYSAQSEITLRASSAMGLDIIWNGQPQAQIGSKGQLLDLRFTATNIDIKLGTGAAPPITSPTTSPASLPATTSASPIPSDNPGPKPTATFTHEPTAPPTNIPPPTFTPTITPNPTSIPSDTPPSPKPPTTVISPTETAILPPRAAAPGFMQTKTGTNKYANGP